MQRLLDVVELALALLFGVGALGLSLLADELLDSLFTSFLVGLLLHFLLFLQEGDDAIGRRRHFLQELLPAAAGRPCLDRLCLFLVCSVGDRPDLLHGHLLNGRKVDVDVGERGLPPKELLCGEPGIQLLRLLLRGQFCRLPAQLLGTRLLKDYAVTGV